MNVFRDKTFQEIIRLNIIMLGPKSYKTAALMRRKVDTRARFSLFRHIQRKGYEWTQSEGSQQQPEREVSPETNSNGILILHF